MANQDNRALICGSIAYDTIMVFQDYFRNHILPDKVHMLNVSFLVPELRREFGGCAGNIAYNLKLLGGKPVPMATVGIDFHPYGEWMDKNSLDRTHVKEIAESYTAQAFITTDMDDNQITAFHPGAMNFSHENQIKDASDISIGMVSPDGRDGMFEHARQFKQAGIPFIFDPGQGMPMFNGQELLEFLELADWVTVNDYEAQLFHERTGMSSDKLAERLQALIITRGSAGSFIITKEKTFEIGCVQSPKVVDPTGCGDAYRAGLLMGLLAEMDWETTGRIAALMGAIKVSHHGTQNHHFQIDEFTDNFKQTFGYNF